MAKIKTADLIGPAFDWAVAVAEGHKPAFWPAPEGVRFKPTVQVFHPNTEWGAYTPSTNPAQGQPILEREGICLKSENRDHSVWSAQFAYCRQVLRWPRAELVFSYCLQHGPTMLVAGLRCFVASRLGDEVEVPDELVNGG